MRIAEHLFRAYVIIMCTDFHGIMYSMFSPRDFSVSWTKKLMYRELSDKVISNFFLTRRTIYNFVSSEIHFLFFSFV